MKSNLKKNDKDTTANKIIVKKNGKKKTANKVIEKKVGSKKTTRKTKLRRILKEKILSKNVLRRHTRKNLTKKSKQNRGVVYLGHVPHGFYENEMKAFFSQFGKVTNINIPRSNRTGRYKGYAFVEFLYPDVAKIVAETMNNYLMFQKILKAKYIPPAEQKPMCFLFPKYKTPLIVRRQKFLRQESNRVLHETTCRKQKDRLQKLLSNKLKKLEKLGIDYKFQVEEGTQNLCESDVESDEITPTLEKKQ